MVKSPLQQPALRALDRLPDTAWARIFDVSRQSVGQWRRYASIPRHFMRTFAALHTDAAPKVAHTGASVDEQLEYAELAKGIHFEDFVKVARARYAAEFKRKQKGAA